MLYCSFREVKQMKNEYFEMNRLDSTNSLDTDPMKYKQTHSRIRSESIASAGQLTDADTAEVRGCDSDIKQVKSRAVILAVLASVAAITAAAVIIGIFISGKPAAVGHDGLDKTVSLTGSSQDKTNPVSEKVIGTGSIFGDCDILSEPNKSAITVGRLAGDTDVLVFASIGEYYKISDTNQLLTGYVLKEQVNIVEIDTGSSDEPVEQADDNA